MGHSISFQVRSKTLAPFMTNLLLSFQHSTVALSSSSLSSRRRLLILVHSSLSNSPLSSKHFSRLIFSYSSSNITKSCVVSSCQMIVIPVSHRHRRTPLDTKYSCRSKTKNRQAGTFVCDHFERNPGGSCCPAGHVGECVNMRITNRRRVARVPAHKSTKRIGLS